MEIAKVIPIFKIGETDTVSNYRPVSILPEFSKYYWKGLYIIDYVALLIKMIYSMTINSVLERNIAQTWL